jgi:DNA invertase Pin-like site-specific DNA recombinase
VTASRSRRRRAGDPYLVVGIVRVSKEEQALSPEGQRTAMAQWCDRNRATLVAVHEDHLCSVTPIDKRPGLMSALDDLRVHSAGVLLCAKRDRLSRDPILTAMIERLAERAGAVVRSVAGEGTDADDPSSMLMRRIVDAFAEYERALIRTRTKTALAVKRSRGERAGAVPWGFVLDPDEVHLRPSPSEQAVVDRVQEAHARGLSQREIVAELARGAVVGRTGRPLTKTQVVRILRRGTAVACGGTA